MKVGVFDSGLGGLTVVQAIQKSFKGAQVIYIADTKNAPYGEKTHKQILDFSVDVTNYLIKNHKIDALIVACNTATSAAIKQLREKFPSLIIIGTEPGIKPAMQKTLTKNIGVLATPATLAGEKYIELLSDLSKEYKVNVFECACAGLVKQIEDGKIEHEETYSMLENWLLPMKEENVDTIVLGCTHYPLISKVIKNILGDEIQLIETSTALAKRLDDLCSQSGHLCVGTLDLKIYYTGEIKKDMIDMILETWEDGGKIVVRKENDE